MRFFFVLGCFLRKIIDLEFNRALDVYGLISIFKFSNSLSRSAFTPAQPVYCLKNSIDSSDHTPRHVKTPGSAVA